MCRAFATPLPSVRSFQGDLLFISMRGPPRAFARMFAPLAGTFEDPATGSANAPLGGLLLSLTDQQRGEFTMLQGVEMGRPSRLEVTAWRTEGGIRATVGGSCVQVTCGEMLV